MYVMAIFIVLEVGIMSTCSVTNIFLFKNFSIPTRLVNLRLSIPAQKNKQFPLLIFIVPEVGIEPTSLTRHDFKSCAYTSSATRAIIFTSKHLHIIT